jgi:hypothetical protein
MTTTSGVIISFHVDGEIYGEHEKMFSKRHDDNEAVLG